MDYPLEQIIKCSLVSQFPVITKTMETIQGGLKGRSPCRRVMLYGIPFFISLLVTIENFKKEGLVDI